MSEFDLVYALSLRGDQLADLLQWWAAMSFGLIGLAHFGQKRLTLPIVVVLLVVYIAFTNNAIQGFMGHLAIQAEIVSDLAALPAGEVSGSTKAVIELNQSEASFWQTLPYIVTFVGPFFGAIGYLLYCYRRTRVNRS